MTPLIASAGILDSPPQRALPTGTQLEEYAIEGVIAHSSVALVYRAYDRVLKLHVAIKEYLPDALSLRSDETQVTLRECEHGQSFERGRQAFVNEARTLARCQHPSLLRVMRVLYHHGTVYRVMPCCVGQTLRQHCHTMIGLPDASELRIWLDNLLGALAELHSLGYVHGAVSPDKILMMSGRRPVLTSSGAVRAALISGSTRRMMAALDPGFMPIEQREPSTHKPLGPWTDLYALAATLGFYLSGRTPGLATGDVPRTFEPLSRLCQRLHGGRVDWPASSSWLKALDACLADSAQDRPQSVAQLQAALEACDVSSRPPLAVTPCAWTPASTASTMTVGGEHPSTVATRGIADLQQTLPFVAARAHEIAAAVCTPALHDKADLARSRRRGWVTGAVLMLMLTVSVAAGQWMRNRSDSAVADAGRYGGGPESPAPHSPAPVVSGTFDHPPTGAGRTASSADVAAVVEPEGVANPGAAPPVVNADAKSGVRMPDSPRARCGARRGYALYQCMQAQCARANWSNHAQCQRLREHQSLS